MSAAISRAASKAPAIACLAGALFLAGCRQTAFGPKLSERQSTEVSALAAEQISAQYLTARASAPGCESASAAFARLARNAADLPRGTALRFAVLETPEQFSISLPSGQCYVSEGLLSLIADNPAEIAALVAHQIGHVAGNHDATNLEAALGQNDLVNMLDQGKYQDVVNTELELQRLSYTNEQEYQADRYAVHLLALSGYDASNLSKLVTRLDSVHGSDDVRGWPESHPISKSRVSRINDAIVALSR